MQPAVGQFSEPRNANVEYTARPKAKTKAAATPPDGPKLPKNYNKQTGK